jgi:hypothetical protein
MLSSFSPIKCPQLSRAVADRFERDGRSGEESRSSTSDLSPHAGIQRRDRETFGRDLFA